MLSIYHYQVWLRVLWLICGFLIFFFSEKKKQSLIPTSFKDSNLNYKYETLEKATNYFNPSSKIGQGGAGSVYKGTLPNGQVVAVKRLVFHTRQWVDEFFNEVNLIRGIQHKNLVALLGCSIEGPESLLVYEYVPNRSLDQFIFGNFSHFVTIFWCFFLLTSHDLSSPLCR